MKRNYLHLGDVRDFARQLVPGSVQMIVTSPPYYGLRDYNIPPAVWDGDAACAHAWDGPVPSPWLGSIPGPGNPGKSPARQRKPRTSGRWCRHCGAWLGKLGSEPTVEQFVAHLVEVCALLWAALAPSGSLWLNLGDSYAHRSANTGARSSSDGVVRRAAGGDRTKAYGPFKHKDLLGVPWRVAMALQEWGWYLRADNVWHKPNALPESVKDRPSRDHEYLFLLTKHHRYYYNADAIKVPGSGTAHSRGSGVNPKAALLQHGESRANASWSAATKELVGERNARTVWSINTVPCPGEHDSTFPPDLVRRCVLASTRPGELVADPFMGSCTTAMVCHEEGRDWVGCDADPRAEGWLRDRLAGLPVGRLVGV